MVGRRDRRRGDRELQRRLLLVGQPVAADRQPGRQMHSVPPQLAGGWRVEVLVEEAVGVERVGPGDARRWSRMWRNSPMSCAPPKRDASAAAASTGTGGVAGGTTGGTGGTGHREREQRSACLPLQQRRCRGLRRRCAELSASSRAGSGRSGHRCRRMRPMPSARLLAIALALVACSRKPPPPPPPAPVATAGSDAGAAAAPGDAARTAVYRTDASNDHVDPTRRRPRQDLHGGVGVAARDQGRPATSSRMAATRSMPRSRRRSRSRSRIRRRATSAGVASPWCASRRARRSRSTSARSRRPLPPRTCTSTRRGRRPRPRSSATSRVGVPGSVAGLWALHEKLGKTAVEAARRAGDRAGARRLRRRRGAAQVDRRPRVAPARGPEDRRDLGAEPRAARGRRLGRHPRARDGARADPRTRARTASTRATPRRRSSTR